VKGEEICRGMKSLKPVLPIIRYHHERWDGGGYPDGLRGEDIPLSARILQVADIYDALTTARPYKPALDSEKAFQVLNEEASRGWRDQELVFLFKQLHGAASRDGADAAALQRSQLELMNQALHGSPNGFAAK
ncbi:MAG: HD domain-containing phosphohydrolase, partial [Bryobacteraceae bacterium]